MSRILAIETDSKRKRLLAELVREFVTAELKIADSARAAIATIGEQIPDLILTPALLSPRESAELTDHIRQLQHAPYVQVLTIPGLDLLSERPHDDRRGLLGPLFARRAVEPSPNYDRALVGAQIADGLSRAHEARREHEAAVACQEELARSLAERRELALLRPFDGAMARQAGIEDLVVESFRVNAWTWDERRAAPRRVKHDLPWLSDIKLGWGPSVSLVNISSSGVLMETGTKFLPGGTTELHLTGPVASLAVPVRFVRSDVARIDRLGVKYHVAATFDREIDLSGPRGATRLQSRALADLFASALARPEGGTELAHVAFVRGVRELVGARDVQLRTIPPGSVGGRDDLCFDVPDDRFRRTLHVVFDPHHSVTDEDRKVLRAAALLTAAALELDAPARRTEPDTVNGTKLLEACVA